MPGWRINGKSVWVWCFCNPRLALYLVDKHRSAAVVKAALGDSLPGVLVTDFYAAYHAIDCLKQKCLVHLLRELHTLRDDVSSEYQDSYIQPLMTLLQDAIALGKSRRTTESAAYESARQQLEHRLDTLISTRPAEKDCWRINNRLVKHRFDLLRFLTIEGLPADNNLGERDIRSVAAARSEPHRRQSQRLRFHQKHRPHLPKTGPAPVRLRPLPPRPHRPIPTPPQLLLTTTPATSITIHSEPPGRKTPRRGASLLGAVAHWWSLSFGPTGQQFAQPGPSALETARRNRQPNGATVPQSDERLPRWGEYPNHKLLPGPLASLFHTTRNSETSPLGLPPRNAD